MSKKKYRIISYLNSVGEAFYYVEEKGWVFWHVMIKRNGNRLFLSFEEAKEALEVYKKHVNYKRKPIVVWEE